MAKYRLSVVIEKDAIRLHIEDRIANKEEIPKSEMITPLDHKNRSMIFTEIMKERELQFPITLEKFCIRRF